MSFSIERIRADFPALTQEVSGKGLVYLDSAATAQRPRAVISAVQHYFERDNANVHRGIHALSMRATESYEGARHEVMRFLGVDDEGELIFTRGTTTSINLVARTWGDAFLQAGDEIVLSIAEHHSNIVPWQLLAERTGAVLRFIDIDDEGRLRLDELDGFLAGGRVKLVAIAHVSNVLGTIHPVTEIARRAHAAGALLLLDGAQGAAHGRLNLPSLGADFYALSSHKIGGPTGIGVLWARRALLEAMPPFEGGGDMIEYVYPDHSTWNKLPMKFEAGTPSIAEAIGFGAAAKWWMELDRDAAEKHEADVVNYAAEQLRQIKGLTLYGPTNPAERRSVTSFTLADVHPHDLSTILDGYGVAIRAGHHCCQPLMRRLGVSATARASFFVYSTRQEVDKLVEGLKGALTMFGVLK